MAPKKTGKGKAVKKAAAEQPPEPAEEAPEAASAPAAEEAPEKVVMKKEQPTLISWCVRRAFADALPSTAVKQESGGTHAADTPEPQQIRPKPSSCKAVLPALPKPSKARRIIADDADADIQYAADWEMDAAEVFASTPLPTRRKDCMGADSIGGQTEEVFMDAMELETPGPMSSENAEHLYGCPPQYKDRKAYHNDFNYILGKRHTPDFLKTRWETLSKLPQKHPDRLRFVYEVTQAKGEWDKEYFENVKEIMAEDKTGKKGKWTPAKTFIDKVGWEAATGTIEQKTVLSRPCGYLPQNVEWPFYLEVAFENEIWSNTVNEQTSMKLTQRAGTDTEGAHQFQNLFPRNEYYTTRPAEPRGNGHGLPAGSNSRPSSPQGNHHQPGSQDQPSYESLLKKKKDEENEKVTAKTLQDLRKHSSDWIRKKQGVPSYNGEVGTEPEHKAQNSKRTWESSFLRATSTTTPSNNLT